MATGNCWVFPFPVFLSSYMAPCGADFCRERILCSFEFPEAPDLADKENDQLNKSMLILPSYYPCLPRMTLHLVSVSLFGLFCFKSTEPNLVKFYILPRWTKVVMYLNSLVTLYHILGSSDLHVIIVCLS